MKGDFNLLKMEVLKTEFKTFLQVIDRFKNLMEIFYAFAKAKQQQPSYKIAHNCIKTEHLIFSF